jgi:hypothetical protein
MSTQATQRGGIEVGVILEVIWARPEVRIGCLLAVITAVAVARARSRSGRPWVGPAGLTAVVGTVLTVTLFDARGAEGAPGILDQCRLGGLTATASELMTWSGLANVILFVPVGLFAAMTAPLARGAFLMGTGLSLLIEVTQGALGTRDCSSVDLVANTVGVALGVVTVWATRRARSATRRSL